MSRPLGRRNAHYADRRAELVAGLADALMSEPHASLRSLARSTGVTPPTLRHYFGTRDGVLDAVLDWAIQQHRERCELLATGPDEVERSIRDAVESIREGWAAGLDRQVRWASVTGRFDRMVAPWMNALESRLARHMAAGTLKTTEVRFAALALAGPVFFALMRLDVPSGGEFELFVAAHTRAFLRGFE